MARNAGFMLAEQAANFGESLLLCVVEFEPLAVTRIESRQSIGQRGQEAPEIAVSMRVCRGCRNAVRRNQFSFRTVFPLEGLPPAALPQPVDVTLGKDSA